MHRRLSAWFEKWGYALLCVLCAGVVLLSALWTRQGQQQDTLSRDAAYSMDERLEKAQTEKKGALPDAASDWAARVIRTYSDKVVCFEETGVWQVHRAADFAFEKGEAVNAICAGRVTGVGDGQAEITAQDMTVVYRGLDTLLCREGQDVQAGDQLGTAGGRVPLEGEGHVCVCLWVQGEKEDPLVLLSP